MSVAVPQNYSATLGANQLRLYSILYYPQRRRLTGEVLLRNRGQATLSSAAACRYKATQLRKADSLSRDRIPLVTYVVSVQLKDPVNRQELQLIAFLSFP